MSDGLEDLLRAGSALIDNPGTQGDLKATLILRLKKYSDLRGQQRDADETWSLEDARLRTAEDALEVVEKVQMILSDEEDSGPPRIGVRDLTLLRTLLSISFRWGTELLLPRLLSSFANPTLGGPKIIDLPNSPDDSGRFYSLVLRILGLLFPRGPQEKIPQTLITSTLLHRHIPDILKPSIMLGWLPKSLATDLVQPLDIVRPLILHLLAILQPSQAIVALGSVISSSPSARHIQKTCSHLLSRQLLRPEGVRGLCAAVFGEEDSSPDTADVEKLDHIAKVLASVPSNMRPDEYYSTIVPRILGLLSDASPPSYKRAAAFSLSRLLTYNASKIVLHALHNPFQVLSDNEFSHHLSPSSALLTLTNLIANADPSPTLISSLLSPVVPHLYSLLHHLDHIKTSDPTLRESARSLLSTWVRVVPTPDGASALRAIIDGEELSWDVTLDGQIRRIPKASDPPSLSLFTPDDLQQAEENGELDPNANVLNLYPDPGHFVSFLRTVGQTEVSSALFVDLLEEYRDQKRDDDGNPKKTLLYLQLIMQMQIQLSDTSFNILQRPTHILTFIKHALDSTTLPPGSFENRSNTPHIGHFQPSVAEVAEDRDSDDDMSDSEAFTADDEMKETSINLLLSVLEANEDLSARTAPVLNEIFSLLEPLTLAGPAALRPLAREARMVMTARLASTSDSRLHAEKDATQETYQKALKLLQDPILPVRAHGLLLLRQLVAPESKKEPLDPALVPAILSIFLQSVQDEDSYIFLNAVQGLANMVDSLGKETLRGLMNDYSRGLEGHNWSQQEMDVKVRIGEALSLVIKRCGTTLGSYIDLLVPTLFRIVRSTLSPTVLRTSALSLLADCEVTHPIALLPYIFDLSEGMIDLLQVEMIPSGAATKDGSPPNNMDDDPTSTNSKFPPLRRAGIHFLSLLARETTKLVYDSGFGASLFPETLIKRAQSTLSYIAMTDRDSVVRVMATETGEALGQLHRAIVGL